MPKYGYVIVEGPHDIELVYRLLSPFGIERICLEQDVDPLFSPLIPWSFPPKGDLLKRVLVPHFMQSPTHAVAVHGAEGDSRLIQSLEESAAIVDFQQLEAVGILLDSDALVAPSARYGALRDTLRQKGYQFPDGAGEISSTNPRFGAFVLPDNQTQGTLEDILLECAQHVYPSLLSTATSHADSALQDQSLSNEDLKELFKPAGRKKAIVGSIASVLRPGKAVQVSIQDNRWLRDSALMLPRVKAVRQFLIDLLELEAA